MLNIGIAIVGVLGGLLMLYVVIAVLRIWIAIGWNIFFGKEKWAGRAEITAALTGMLPRALAFFVGWIMFALATGRL